MLITFILNKTKLSELLANNQSQLQDTNNIKNSLFIPGIY